jgi:predicted metal-dependent phosphoesterase TrpH
METSLAVEDQTEIAGVSRARRATAPGVAALPSGRADLHVHSFWSDGAQSPEAIVRAARGRVDVVAITDHDEIRGGLHGRAFAREHPELGLDVVVGEEISTLNGHLLGLYLEERVPPGLTAFATIELIHAQGGLAVAAHPFHPIRGRASGHRSIGELVPDLPLDAIEVVNNSGVFSWVYDAWAALRNLEWLLPVSGGSDAHDVWYLGSAVTRFAGRDGEALRRALGAGRTRVHVDWSWLPEVRVPTLLVWGKDDRITPPEVAERFHALIPESELVLLPNCGHAPMLEQPDAFNSVVWWWLHDTRFRRNPPLRGAGALR